MLIGRRFPYNFSRKCVIGTFFSRNKCSSHQYVNNALSVSKTRSFCLLKTSSTNTKPPVQDHNKNQSVESTEDFNSSSPEENKLSLDISFGEFSFQGALLFGCYLS